MRFSTNRFATAAGKSADRYERRFRKLVPYQELKDALRRDAAFDVPLKFVLDPDEESQGLRKRGPRWDFGNAGVRFERAPIDDPSPTLIATWADDFEQKTLQGVLDELDALGFEGKDNLCIELVSPTGERLQARYGVGLTIERGTVVHFCGNWKEL